MNKDSRVVGLSEAIKELRRELEKARLDGEQESTRFVLSPVELTFQAVLTNKVEGDASAGWHWALLKLGITGSVEKAVTHTVKLTLTPHRVLEDGTLSPVYTVAGNEAEDVHSGPQEDPNAPGSQGSGRADP